MVKNNKQFFIILLAAVFVFSGFFVAKNAFAIPLPPPPPSDTTPPEITAPADQIFEATGLLTTPELVLATATDNEDPNPTITYDPNSFSVGDTTITWTAKDASGNTSTATSKVTIADTTPPVISGTPADIIAEAASGLGAVVAFAVPTASDLVDGAIAVSCDKNSGDNFPVGDTTVTCAAADAAQNSAAKTFKVTVNYVPPPPAGGGGLPYFIFNVFAGANGSISPSSAHLAYGSSQTFSITPNENYQIADVLVDNVSVGAVTTYIFNNITASHAISVNFSLIPIVKNNEALPVDNNIVQPEVLPVIPVVLEVKTIAPSASKGARNVRKTSVTSVPESVAQNVEQPAPPVESVIPAGAGAASVSTTVGDFLISYLWIIILIIILILILLWIIDKFLSEKKEFPIKLKIREIK